MADRPDVNTRRITRDKLAQFLNSQELIKAFENISKDVGEVLPDAIADATHDTGSLTGSDSGRSGSDRSCGRGSSRIKPMVPDVQDGPVLSFIAWGKPCFPHVPPSSAQRNEFRDRASVQVQIPERAKEDGEEIG